MRFSWSCRNNRGEGGEREEGGEGGDGGEGGGGDEGRGTEEWNKEEKRDYNKNTPIDEHEQEEMILSLNNNLRQFKNEFTLIENYEKNNNKFLVEIHKKFTLPVACILFTLVGAPLGILVRKGGITIASGLSIAFFLVYYILLIWGEQLADRALLNPAIGSWMPNIILFILGLIILYLYDRKN